MTDLLDYDTFKLDRTFAIKQEGGEEFKGNEEEMAAIIAYGIYLAGHDNVDELETAIEESNGVQELMMGAIATFGVGFIAVAADQTTLFKNIENQVFESIKTGASLVGDSSFINDVSEQLAVREGIAASIQYSTNEFYDAVVAPKLTKTVAKFTEHGSLATTLKQINTIIDKNILEESAYWKVVANAHVSRAHHYGLLRASYEAGYTGYYLQAVIDDRTTHICRSLNGKTFWVADGLEFIERAVKADETNVKDVAPWVTDVAEVQGQTPAQLKEASVLVPPFHANCRTTLQPIR